MGAEREHLVLGQRPPAGEHHRRPRPHRGDDVGEGGDRVVEEHHSELRDHRSKPPGASAGEIAHLHVDDLEAQLGVQPPSAVDHRRRNVGADRRAPAIGHQSRQTTCSTADVQHDAPSQRLGGRDHGAGNGLEHRLEDVVVGAPRRSGAVRPQLAHHFVGHDAERRVHRCGPCHRGHLRSTDRRATGRRRRSRRATTPGGALGAETFYWDDQGTYHDAHPESLRRVVEVLEADAAAGRRNPAGTGDRRRIRRPIWRSARESTTPASTLADGSVVDLDISNGHVEIPEPLPIGCHTLALAGPGIDEATTIVTRSAGRCRRRRRSPEVLRSSPPPTPCGSPTHRCRRSPTSPHSAARCPTLRRQHADHPAAVRRVPRRTVRPESVRPGQPAALERGVSRRRRTAGGARSTDRRAHRLADSRPAAARNSCSTPSRELPGDAGCRRAALGRRQSRRRRLRPVPRQGRRRPDRRHAAQRPRRGEPPARPVPRPPRPLEIARTGEPRRSPSTCRSAAIRWASRRGPTPTCSPPGWRSAHRPTRCIPTARTGGSRRSCPAAPNAAASPCGATSCGAAVDTPRLLRIDHVLGVHRLWWIPDGDGSW